MFNINKEKQGNENLSKQKEIEIEEKMRVEARIKAEKEIKRKEKREKNIGCLAVFGLVTIFIIIFSVVTYDGGGKKNKKDPLQTVDLSAYANFTGEKFVIVNNDSFDWTNVKLEVNSETLRSGYILNVGKMVAGETYTVGAMQFAKKDGTKLNPFIVKPLNFSIWCDTPDGKGFWYGKW